MAGDIHVVRWATPDPPALVALERSRDGGRSFEQVSPWLAAGVGEYALPALPGTFVPGTVRYRLALRGDRGRSATGDAERPG